MHTLFLRWVYGIITRKEIWGGQNMAKKEENVSFICENCGREVSPLTNGSYRNHCPYCLYSKHVDEFPGDRKSTCGGLMEPIDIVYKSGKGYQIKHHCTVCGKEIANVVAENTIEPDDFDKVLEIVRKNNLNK